MLENCIIKIFSIKDFEMSYNKHDSGMRQMLYILFYIPEFSIFCLSQTYPMP